MTTWDFNVKTRAGDCDNLTCGLDNAIFLEQECICVHHYFSTTLYLLNTYIDTGFYDNNENTMADLYVSSAQDCSNCDLNTTDDIYIYLVDDSGCCVDGVTTPGKYFRLQVVSGYVLDYYYFIYAFDIDKTTEFDIKLRTNNESINLIENDFVVQPLIELNYWGINNEYEEGTTITPCLNIKNNDANNDYSVTVDFYKCTGTTSCSPSYYDSVTQTITKGSNKDFCSSSVTVPSAGNYLVIKVIGSI